MAAVELERLSVVIAGSIVLDDVSMSIDDGELVGVVGPSGSGKTTLLRAIAGLVPVAGGRLGIGGADVTGSPSGVRDVAMVFQQPVLFPTRNVRRNVAFPLELRRQGPAEIRQRVDAEVRALRIEGLLDRDPGELSYGEAQLVQIARALVRVPGVMLLDEPFANLDVHLHARLRAEFGVLQDGYGVTTVMTTNDVDDAVMLPSRLAVLHRGRLVQYAPPNEVRWRPATLSAAIATGPYSVIPVLVTAAGDGYVLVREDPRGGPALRVRAWAPALGDRVGETMMLGIRPSDAVVTSTGPVGAIVRRQPPGPSALIECDVGGSLVFVAPARQRYPTGAQVRLRFDALAVFDRATERAVVHV